MKRIALNPEELLVIERLRSDRAIYNRAIADALSAVAGVNIQVGDPKIFVPDSYTQEIIEAIAALRKES